MLYIKFHIEDSSKFEDFKVLFDLMQKSRDHAYSFEEEINSIEIDWENMSQEEIDEILDKEEEIESNPIYWEMKKFKEVIPKYAMDFISSFSKYDQQSAGHFGFDVDGILGYLVCDLEVDMDELHQIKANNGIVNFSTGNYPFGGLERFLMVLKAYQLIPYECFNGFKIHDFQWTSDFEFNANELLQKTKDYLAKFNS